MTALTRADASGKAVSAGDRALAEALTAALYNTGRIAQDRHMWPTPAALLALAQSQENLAQRKIVIYFTFSADREFDLHAEKSMPSILAAANRAGVSLYIVDLRSLDANGTRQDEIDASRMDFAMALKEMSLKHSSGASSGAKRPTAGSGRPTVGSGWGAGPTDSLSDTSRVTGDIGEDNVNDNEGALQHLAQEQEAATSIGTIYASCWNR